MWEGDGTSRLEYYTVVHPNPGHGGWASTPGVSPMAPSAATRAVSSLTSPGPPRRPSSRVRSGVPVEPLHFGSTGRSHYSPRACPATSQRGSGGGRGPRSAPPGTVDAVRQSWPEFGRGSRPSPLPAGSIRAGLADAHGGRLQATPTQPPGPVIRPGLWLRTGAPRSSAGDVATGRWSGSQPRNSSP